MADLVFKAHRDDGGWGIAPNDATFAVIGGDEKATLTWSVSEKTIIEGQTICNAKGIMIRVSEDGYPEDETKGKLVLNSTDLEGNTVITGLTNGKTYYFSAFPYSDHNVYNRSKTSRGKAVPSHASVISVVFTSSEAVGCEIKAQKGMTTMKATVQANGTATFNISETGTWKIGGQKVTIESLGQSIVLNEKIYGYDWKLSESNPDRNITYPATVDNAGFGNVGTRGADAVISLGDWNDFFENFVCARPVMLNFDGTVAYELNHSNQALKLTGGNSDVADASKNMNAMVEFPKRYFKRWTDASGVAHFRASRIKLGDDWKCYPWLYGNTEETAFENDFIYLPMFEGSSNSSKVRSLSGKTPMNTQAGATEWAQIQALGPGWIFDDFSDACMIVDYMFLMAKSTNVQSHWGTGHESGGSAASSLHTTGRLVGYGPFYGGTGNTDMKFMWLENWYGDRWERTFGVWFISNILYVKDFPPYTVDGTVTNYKNLGRGIGGTSSGYISEVTYDEHGMIPKTASGSETTYVPDGCWFSNGTQFLIRGAACDRSSRVGAAFSVNRPFSYSSWNFGPSPAYKCPTA